MNTFSSLQAWLLRPDNRFFALQAAGWTGWLILFTLRDFYHEALLGQFMVLLFAASTGFALTCGLRYIYRAVWDRPLLVRVVTVVVASYMTALVWQPMKNYVSFQYWGEMEKMVEEYGFRAYFSGIIGYSFFLLIGWSGLYFGIKYYQLLQDETRRRVLATAMAHEAQLRMLRYQLNPHFLFNTLNAISTLILARENETAGSMVGKLSNFLRYSLDKDPMQKVPLDQEVDTLRLYLDIEKVRFEDRLTVRIDIQDTARSALVPSLLIQPLIENSVKYAVARSEQGGTIWIEGRLDGNELLLEVRDNGPGIALEDGRLPEFNGVGLRNLRERLEELYPGAHTLTFENQLPSGLGVKIRIPYEQSQ